MKVTFTFVSSKPVNPKREEIICQKKKTHLCQVRSDKEMLGIYKKPANQRKSKFLLNGYREGCTDVLRYLRDKRMIWS